MSTLYKTIWFKHTCKWDCIFLPTQSYYVPTGDILRYCQGKDFFAVSWYVVDKHYIKLQQLEISRNKVKVVSALFAHFLTRFLKILTNSIHKSRQIIMLVNNLWLWKISRFQVLATLCVQRLYVQFILVCGLLTGSDIMAKIDSIWLMFVS